MKMTFMSYAATLLLAASLFACKKETATPLTEASNSPASILVEGKAAIENPQIVIPTGIPFWTIGSFIISGNNITRDYDGVRFQFSDENMVTATIGEVSVNGKWYMKNAHRLFLSFNSSGLLPIAELNGEWTITRINAQSMFLRSDDLLFPKDLRFDTNSK